MHDMFILYLDNDRNRARDGADNYSLYYYTILLKTYAVPNKGNDIHGVVIAQSYCGLRSTGAAYARTHTHARTHAHTQLCTVQTLG